MSSFYAPVEPACDDLKSRTTHTFLNDSIFRIVKSYKLQNTGVSAKLSRRWWWRGRRYLHIQGESAFSYADADDDKTKVHILQKPNSKLQFDKFTNRQVDPGSKNLVPIIVAGGKNEIIFEQ